jgi:uncharacterized protein
MNSQDPPIVLRGHTLLCLQGFRGEGYSARFVENLGTIHGKLLQHPERLVEVVEQPDAVCGACPHQAVAGCELNGQGSEANMQAQDRTVLAQLGLQAGQQVMWRDILERIRHRVNGADLPGICGGCRWLPLGYCREGIERLKSSELSTAVPSASLIVPIKKTS